MSTKMYTLPALVETTPVLRLGNAVWAVLRPDRRQIADRRIEPRGGRRETDRCEPVERAAVSAMSQMRSDIVVACSAPAT